MRWLPEATNYDWKLRGKMLRGSLFWLSLLLGVIAITFSSDGECCP